MHHALIRVESDDAAGIVVSLSPETGRDLPRTSVNVRMESDVGLVEISAADTSALRAALNSYLECIRITEDIIKITR
jgi:KEOPS complex subunit Pcc1